MGTMGKAIPLRVRSRRARAPKVAKQIGTPRSSTPSCGGQCADREEKRVAHGNEINRQQGKKQEQLDFRDPNQRRLLVICNAKLFSYSFAPRTRSTNSVSPTKHRANRRRVSQLSGSPACPVSTALTAASRRWLGRDHTNSSAFAYFQSQRSAHHHQQPISRHTGNEDFEPLGL